MLSCLPCAWPGVCGEGECRVETEPGAGQLPLTQGLPAAPAQPPRPVDAVGAENVRWLKYPKWSLRVVVHFILYLYYMD